MTEAITMNDAGTMSDAGTMNGAVLLLAWLAGLVLGAVFFGGLWWTVRRGLASPQPALWFLGSFIVRVGIVLVGFYLVGQGHWERLLICLLGFFIARWIVTWLTRPKVALPHISSKEATSHAP